MKQSTKDRVQGQVNETKGAVKEKVGQVINKPEMAEEGQDEQVTGKVQKKVGQIDQVVGK